MASVALAATLGLGLGLTPAFAAATPPAELFLQQAAGNNHFVSQASELALKSSHDAQVQAFARGVGARRSALTQQFRGAVGLNWRTIVNDGSSGAFQTRLPQLIFAAQKGEFDRAYLQSQVDASAALKADLDGLIKTGAPTRRLSASALAKLRKQAQDASPAVESDLRAAKALLARGAPSAAPASVHHP